MAADPLYDLELREGVSEDALLWDTGVIDDEEWPGLFAVLRPKRANKWKRETSKGEHGEEPKFGGTENAEFQILIRFHTAEQRDALRDIYIPKLDPVPGKDEPKPLSIAHPITEGRNIDFFLVDSVQGPDPFGDEGEWAYRIDCFEYREPEPAPPLGQGQGTPCAALVYKWKQLNLKQALLDPDQQQESLEIELQKQEVITKFASIPCTGYSLGPSNQTPPPDGDDDEDDALDSFLGLFS